MYIQNSFYLDWLAKYFLCVLTNSVVKILFFFFFFLFSIIRLSLISTHPSLISQYAYVHIYIYTTNIYVLSIQSFLPSLPNHKVNYIYTLFITIIFFFRLIFSLCLLYFFSYIYNSFFYIFFSPLSAFTSSLIALIISFFFFFFNASVIENICNAHSYNYKYFVYKCKLFLFFFFLYFSEHVRVYDDVFAVVNSPLLGWEACASDYYPALSHTTAGAKCGDFGIYREYGK